MHARIKGEKLRVPRIKELKPLEKLFNDKKEPAPSNTNKERLRLKLATLHHISMIKILIIRYEQIVTKT